MRYRSIIFLFLCTSVHANWSTLTETEPSTLIEGIASVITGHVYLPEEDIIVEGAEPLRLKRNYVGVGQQHQLFPHLFAEFLVSGRKINVVEPNGTTLSFVHHPLTYRQQKKMKRNKEHTHHYIFDPIDLSGLPGASNTSRGILSARTNIKNTRVELHPDWKCLIVRCADGTQRRYLPVPEKVVKTENERPYHQYNFYLKSEDLPNGNKILYDWEGIDLTSVRTTNPAENTTYAQVHFRHPLSTKINVTTSDGRHLEYSCEGWGEKNEFILSSIISPQFPDETLHYEERMGHPFLKEVQLPEGRRFSIVRDEAHRVKEIQAPVGNSDALIATHTFTYFPEQRRTDVANSQGAITRYFWSEESRLTCIERYTKDGKLYNRERMGWGQNGTRDAGNLLFRTLFDQDNKPISSRSFCYDNKGNVEEEILWGNLSGAGVLKTKQDGRPIGGETYKKRFQYNELNLVVREEEDKGKVVTYEYLPGTNLCTAVFTYDGSVLKRRHFTVYYGDLVPVREIDDDGSTININDLTSVTQRIIKDIKLVDSGPYINLPQCIEDKYMENGRETLLKRTVLHYTTGANISRQEIYDAHGNFCYALYTEYDHKGRPIVESNALGQVAKSRYDEIGNKIFFSDFSGNTELHMSYDHSNRLKRIEERAQDNVRITEHVYDTQSNRIATTDFRNNTTHYIYDDFNHVIETHTPFVLDTEGQVIHPILRAQYDSAGQEIVSIDAKGNTTRTKYNAYGKPIEIKYADGTKEYFSYYLNGTLKTHTDPIGTQTTYTYDVFDRETAKIISFEDEILSQEFFTYNSYQLIKKTDAEGHTTHYTYDGAGRKIAEELDDRRTSYSYDALGRLEVIEQDGLFRIKEYDLLNRLIGEKKQDANVTILFQEEYRYDAAGNKSAHITYPNNTRAEEIYCYDAFNRLIEKKDPLGFVTTTVYLDQYENDIGQRVLQKVVTDAMHNRTIETYDAKERLVCQQKTKPENKLLSQEDYFYDANDNISRQKSSVLCKNSVQRTITTRWFYDALNRINWLQEAYGEPEARTTHYTYTLKGQLEERKKPDGVSLHYVYDRLGRCTEIRSSDNSVHYLFDYNRLGQLIHSTDVLSQASNEKKWNLHGQLHYERLSHDYSLSSEYDKQGRRTTLYLPDGAQVIYTHDPLFMRSIQRVRGNSSYTHYFTSYDRAGNLLEERHIDGTQSQYGIDCLGRKYSISHPSYAQQVLSYDPVGNILSMQFPEERVEYRYDDLYQLEGETGHFAHGFAYDSHFNRVKKDDVAYMINAQNQLPRFTYDPNGNPITDGHRHFSYDALDRLICIEENGNRYLFTYDAEHRRIKKQAFASGYLTETVYFLYDGQNEIGSIDQNGQWRDLRILGPTSSAEIGATVAIELRGQLCLPLHDLQGNICMVIPQGGIPERYRYSAFGEEYAPRARCPWRFSSKRTDETQLVYFGRRYYSPQHGRWLTPDPLGLSTGMNLYAFVNNDPLNRVDLYGLKSSLKRSNAHNATPAEGVKRGIDTAYYVLSMPFRAAIWTVGTGFLSDWKFPERSTRSYPGTRTDSLAKGIIAVGKEAANPGIPFRCSPSMRSAFSSKEVASRLSWIRKE